MSQPASNRVRAQDFYDYHKCPHRVYLNRFGDPQKKLPHSDFLNLIFERGILHEQDVIRDLPFVAPQGKRGEEQAEHTLSLMQAGAERIFQGVLIQGADSGQPDLLEKVPGKSKLGDYFYKPVDIKSASGWHNEEKQTLRPDYGLQLFHYGVLLDQVQGFFPPEGEILNRDKQRIAYKLPQFANLYSQVYPHIADLIAGKQEGEPARTGDCENCQWWAHCERLLTAANDVSLLPEIGRGKRAALVNIGVRTMQDFIRHDFAATPVKGFGDKTITRVKNAATAITTGQMQILAKPALPDADLKIYLDFEDDPTQELIYLCGVWTDPEVRSGNYIGLFAADETTEKKLWSEFQRFCAEIDGRDYVVFHYSPYERTKLAQLEKKYGADEPAALHNFRSRMYDLQKIAEETVVLPERSYSLKKVGKYAGHKYSAANPSGGNAIVWFQQLQQEPNKGQYIIDLLTYNLEDCKAMKSVCDWLKTLG